ncbi:MAG: site-specific DNA-methyltransferase [Legionella sp.]|uniref:DNA-methyltransferase n=1 Tax=Legionella sp. TaxID=459 RepID=UPI0028415A95|nr:site-specific DNA-methyltransferase [Legionella sp.]
MQLISPDNKITLHFGDCLTVLDTLDAESIDSCVSDPPYEINFKGNGWDNSGIAFRKETWEKMYRVLKPGSWLVAFSATRTYHRMVCAIEDAGFEIKDQLGWVYSNGFPKNLNIYKAMKKKGIKNVEDYKGLGSALSPSWEPIVLARKPLKGTNVSNILEYGTGGLNISGCMIGDEVRTHPLTPVEFFGIDAGEAKGEIQEYIGRWPKNILHDGSAEVEKVFKENTSIRSKENPARYFYSAKATAAEKAGSNHPTCKPISLMRYLCRLVTPKGGTVIDLFAGSGSTGQAARKEGFKAVLIELMPEYQGDIARRLGLKADFSDVDESIDVDAEYASDPPAADLVSFFD